METKNNKQVNVFLADDDSDDRELFLEAINEAKLPMNFISFRDGDELMNHLYERENINPDIIFLDINMPLKNGKECLADIRSSTNWNHVPVVMFSTSLNQDDIADTYKLGANLFISKPSNFASQIEIFRYVFSLYHEQKLIGTPFADFLLTASMPINPAFRM